MWKTGGPDDSKMAHRRQWQTSAVSCQENFIVPGVDVDSTDDDDITAPINSRLNVVVRFPTLFGLGRNGCWPFRGSQVPRALPFIFSLCCSLNDRRRAARSFFKIGRLFSLFFSCPSSSAHSSPSLDER